MRQRSGIILSAIVMTMLTHPVLLGGCSPTAPYTGVNAVAQKAGPGSLTQVQLQALVMNFADVYVMTTWQAYDAIRSSTTDPKRRALAQYFKVITTSNAMTIAAGRNSVVNLLDMLVFVSLDRSVIETYWVPQVLGAHGEPLATTYRKLEQDIWKASSRVLSEAQQSNLRGLVQQWIAANPEQHYTAAIRFSDFAELHGGSKASQLEVGNLLADVEKAVAVAEEGLLLSERIMFLAERAPRMVTVQMDLILDQMAAAPDAELLRVNLNRLTAASERLSQVAADLPKYVTQERQAAIDHAFNRLGGERKQLMTDLESQGSQLRGVLEDVRGLLDRATPLTEKLEGLLDRTTPLTEKLSTTIHSADALYRLFDASPSKLPQYHDLLAKSIVAMDKLERILAEVTPLYAAITKDTDIRNDPLLVRTVGLADHFFWRGMLLISFFLVGSLGVLLAYRYLSLKMREPATARNARPGD